ncbi:MAG: oxygenase MpaB family protein, partial [Candidatus Binatia bacterium]
AHPLVAAGVADHSDFRNDPLGRLRRTLEAMLTITFGTVEEAETAYRSVNALHGRVRGVLPAATGPFPDGTSYRARDPELLLWVHATLVDTAMLVYRRCVRELPRREWERYYEESRITARLFRIPERMIPRDLGDFRSYMRRMLAGPELAVGDVAREIAARILHPPVPLLPAALFDPLNLLTAGFLPPRLRAEFGFPWGPVRRVLFEAGGLGIRSLVPWLPDLVRSMPAARSADRRILGTT